LSSETCRPMRIASRSAMLVGRCEGSLRRSCPGKCARTCRSPSTRCPCFCIHRANQYTQLLSGGDVVIRNLSADANRKSKRYAGGYLRRSCPGKCARTCRSPSTRCPCFCIHRVCIRWRPSPAKRENPNVAEFGRLFSQQQQEEEKTHGLPKSSALGNALVLVDHLPLAVLVFVSIEYAFGGDLLCLLPFSQQQQEEEKTHGLPKSSSSSSLDNPRKQTEKVALCWCSSSCS
jgi:hypothetical protein